MGRERDLLFGIIKPPKANPSGAPNGSAVAPGSPPVERAPTETPLNPEKRKKKGQRKLRCTYEGCRATFNDPRVYQEHLRTPHERCPGCKKYFRCLAVHQALATVRRRKHRRCWPPGRVADPTGASDK